MSDHPRIRRIDPETGRVEYDDDLDPLGCLLGGLFWAYVALFFIHRELFILIGACLLIPYSVWKIVRICNRG